MSSPKGKLIRCSRVEKINSLKGFHRYIITGASGHLGQKVVLKFLATGATVYGIDKVPQGDLYLKNNYNYHHLLLDLTGAEAKLKLDQLMKKERIDWVVHLASLNDEREGELYPRLYKRSNVITTMNLLKIMRRNNLNRIIFASDALLYKQRSLTSKEKQEVKTSPESYLKDDSIHKKLGSKYGNLSAPPSCIMRQASKETDEIDRSSIYQLTKYKCEEIISEYCRCYSFQAIIFRIFEMNNKFLKESIQSILKNNQITISGPSYPTRDGTIYRDYIHVKDVARAVSLATVRFNHIVSSLEKFYPKDRIVIDREIIPKNKIIPGEKVILNDKINLEDNYINEIDLPVESLEENIVLLSQKVSVKKSRSEPVVNIDPHITLMKSSTWSGEEENKGFFRVYNLGSEICYTDLQVVRQISQHLQKSNLKDLKINFKVPTEKVKHLFLSDCERAKKELDWRVKFTLNDLIRDTILEVEKDLGHFQKPF